MEKQNITVRITTDRVQSLDAIGRCVDRDRSYLINEAIDQYLAVQAWQVEQIKEAVAEADAGRFADNADVQAFTNTVRR